MIIRGLGAEVLGGINCLWGQASAVKDTYQATSLDGFQCGSARLNYLHQEIGLAAIRDCCKVR